jgi:hypothetical protein
MYAECSERRLMVSCIPSVQSAGCWTPVYRVFRVQAVGLLYTECSERRLMDSCIPSVQSAG